MKKATFISFAGLLALFTPLHAQTTQSDSGYKPATVVSLKSHMMPANFIGGVIQGEIPQPQEYFYDIEVRLDCNLYIGRYESSTVESSASFDVNSTVKVRMTDNQMSLMSHAGHAVATDLVSAEPISGCSADR